MAQHQQRSEAMNAALARLDQVSLGEGIDYEQIGRVVVARLLARQAAEPGDDPEKVRATLEFALRRRSGSAGERQAECCCVCWVDEYGVWECVGSCCPDNGWLD